MSDYVREKVLRVPVDCINLDYIKSKVNTDNLIDEEDLYELVDEYLSDLDKFEIASTEKFFIDYILEYEYGVWLGEYGKNRSLYAREKEKYLPIFKQLYPDIDMNMVRLVEFCWYNGTEAPDYYNEVYDDFYKEI